MNPIKDKQEFDTNVVKNTLPVLVDFSATWCGPCRNLAPIVEEFAKANAGKIGVYTIDIDEAREVAEEYGIQAVPTLMIFDKGKKLAERTGAMPKAALSKWVNQTLGIK